MHPYPAARHKSVVVACRHVGSQRQSPTPLLQLLAGRLVSSPPRYTIPHTHVTRCDTPLSSHKAQECDCVLPSRSREWATNCNPPPVTCGWLAGWLAGRLAGQPHPPHTHTYNLIHTSLIDTPLSSHRAHECGCISPSRHQTARCNTTLVICGWLAGWSAPLPTHPPQSVTRPCPATGYTRVVVACRHEYQKRQDSTPLL
jgi:hypothetical protein